MMNPNPLLELLGGASLRAAALILLLLALRPWLRRAFGSPLVSLLWLVVLVRLLVPWSAESAWHPFTLPLRVAAPIAEATSPWKVRVAVQENTGMTARASRADIVSPRVSRYEIVFGIWTAGALAALVFFGARSWRTRNLVQRATPASDPRLLQTFLAIPESVRRQTVLHVTAEIPVAALVGIWRPQILLPRDWVTALSDAELRYVLLHELGHARRGDLLIQWLFALAQSLHWFNPVVWMVSRWARADAELACDAWVLARSGDADRESYGDTLLKTSQLFRRHVSMAPVAVGMAASRQALVSRIRHVGAYHCVTRWRALLGIALAGLVATLLMTHQSAAEAPERDARPATPAPASEPSVAPATDAPKADSKPAAEAKPAPETKSSAETKSTGGSAPAAEAKPAAHVPATPAKPVMIEIESKFFEVSESTAKKVGLISVSPDSNSTIGGNGRKPVQLKPPLLPSHSVLSVLQPSEVDELLRKLTTTKGVDLLSAPRLTSKSGQRGTIEIIREFRYATEWSTNTKTKELTPVAFETRNLGVTMQVEPVAVSDDSLDLTITPEVVELEGYVNPKGNKPVPLLNGRSVGANLSIKDFSSVKWPKDAPLQPVFSTRKITTSVTIMPGDTILLGGLKREDRVEGQPPISRVLYILVTARTVKRVAELKGETKEVQPEPEAK